MAIRKILWEAIGEIATHMLNKHKPVAETIQVDPAEVIQNESLVAGEKAIAQPITTGRSSVPNHVNTFAPKGRLAEIPPDFAIEFLATLENLAAFNSDISYALDNIVQLANTPHEVFFSDQVNDEEAKKMRLFLKENEGGWYQFSGGIHSLKADLLTQVIINGALSAEIIPGSKSGNGLPDHVKQVVRIAPKYIRFVYDPEKDIFLPYQQPRNGVGLNGNFIGANSNFFGLIELNTRQYHYIAWRRFFESPYAVPPFITAIEDLIIKKDMKVNLKNVMKKLGMLGFLTALVNPPARNTGEKDEAYFNRLNDNLIKNVAPQMEKSLGKGFVAGYLKQVEFKLEGNNMNVQGAAQLMQLVDQMIFAGVKQDPNMNGQNFSTTETFGRVILAKTISQAKDYQSIVDEFISHVYLMALRLEGFSPGYVEVKSEAPMVGDKFKEEQTNKLRIENVILKRNENIIDQQIAANELFYDEPAGEAPVTPVPGDGNGNTSHEEDDPKDPSNEEQSEEIKVLETRLKKHVDEFLYEYPGCGEAAHNHDRLNTVMDFQNEAVNQFSRGYFNQIKRLYDKTAKTAASVIAFKLRGLSELVSLEAVQETVYVFMLLTFANEYLPFLAPISEDNIILMYNQFRRDKEPFGVPSSGLSNAQSFAVDIPDAVISLDDFRTMEYLAQSDPLYLGKFITDEDTKRRVFRAIEREYIQNGLPIGNNPKLVNRFKNMFEELMELEAYKIRRIIDTTVVKARNFAAISYMDQAFIETYEVVEIIDNLTCPYCIHMNGNKFSVKSAVQKIQSEVSAGPAMVKETNPFATEIKPDVFTKMSNEELASAGFLMPTFHPHCRGRTIAVFSS